MVYWLAISLLLLFVLSFFINKKNIISPAFVFTFSFVFQAIWAIFYAKAWELGLHINTFLVIVLGVAEFIAASFLIHLVFKYLRKRKKMKCETKNENIVEDRIKFIKINKVLEFLYLIFVILISGIYLYYIVKSVNGSFLNILTVMEAISKFDNLSKFSEEFVRLPFLIINLEELVIASGYWFIYVVINNFLYNKKINIIEILIVVISIISSMLSGSRTTAFMIMFAAIVIFIMIMQRKKGKINILTLKLVRNIAIVGFAFILIFYTSAQAWGRASKNDKMYYFAIYCGAEIKNLDIFLQEEAYEKNSEIWGSQTFYSIIQTLGKRGGINNFQEYKLDLPFREVNGLNLGNVYTTFYPYIYDFGYIGEFVLVLLMAIIAQSVFEIANNSKIKGYPKISVLVYSSIFNCLILSFFSNKFYENIFSTLMIKHIIFWIILNFIFCKLDYKKVEMQLKKLNLNNINFIKKK